MDGERRIIDRGGVYVENGRIVAVGPLDYLKNDYEPETVLEFPDGIVMPGLVCAHTHLYGILLRGGRLHLPPPTDFTQSLQRIWWPIDESMNVEDAYASALSASLEMLLNGVTFFADTFSGPNAISGVLDNIERAVNKVGLRAAISFEATERHSREEGLRGVEENLRFIRRRARGRVFGMMSLHASFTLTDELIEYAVEKARELGAKITIHVSEGLWDLYHNMERYGERTLERLHRIGLLGEDAVLAHAVHVNGDEISLMKKDGVHVVHNPLSNMLNAVGIAPIPEMLEAGINVALGNDGYIFDPFENIRAAFLIHKLAKRDPRYMTPLQVLEMATINGARAYGLEEEIGSLEPGKSADIIVIRPKLVPTPLNSETVYGHLVNAVDGGDVDTVIVEGEPLVSGGMPTRIDVEEVNDISQGAVEKLWGRFHRISEQLDVTEL